MIPIDFVNDGNVNSSFVRIINVNNFKINSLKVKSAKILICNFKPLKKK